LEAGCSVEEALDACYHNSRDNGRTPMQWDDGPNAGFTTGTPWLKVNPNYKEINVKAQQQDPDSVLNFYKKVIALRKSPEYKETFVYGTVTPIFENEDGIFAFIRKAGKQEVVVIANFGQEQKELELKGVSDIKILLNNKNDIQQKSEQIIIDSCQVIVFEKCQEEL
jgi:oligo-1,6-glucosidase